MSEAARSRRDDPRYEPQMAAPRRDAPQGHADPLAELARLVGQDDPFRSVFRPAAAPAPVSDAPYHAATEPQGHDGYHDEAYGEADHYYDEAQAYHDDPAYDAAHDGHGHAAHDGYGHDGHHHEAYDERYAGVGQDGHYDDAGLADGHFVTDAAAASALPDMWARGADGSDANGSALDHGLNRPAADADRRSSARRPLAVLGAVLVLTVGGLGASFLAKGSSTSSVSSVRSAGGAPTIMAATGPTKVKVEDPGATAPEDQDAALLNKNANLSSGPVKIVSSQEQPVDLGQLPKTSDLADGARPLPPPSPSPFPEPKKVKTFVVHPDGSMLSADGLSPDAAGSAAPASTNTIGAALPATPKTASRGGTTPQSASPQSVAAPSAPPQDAIAALSAQPADPVSAKPARQPAAPGVRTASAKPNDTADAPAASGGGYGIQVASSPVEADASAAFAKLKKKYPAQLGSLTPTIHKAETGDKPVYRVRVGSMSQDEAKALCAQLPDAHGCFVVRN